MSQAQKTYLTPPEPDRKGLSFVASKPRALSEWEAQLPKVNHAETAKKLYAALREINRLKTGPGDRLELLDTLANSIENAADGLFKSYLEQPLELSDIERKVVALCQGLAIELATGYKSVAQAADRAAWGLSRKETVARALHHCMWALLPNLRRCFSMYLPAPSGLWSEMHELFRLAHKAGSENQSFAWSGKQCTLSQAYKAALLFDIAQPFQLQRYELDPLYFACMSWAPLARLRPASDPGTYMINLTIDRGPIYMTDKTTLNAGMLSLHTSELIGRLNGGGDLPDFRGMTPRLKSHLAMAWDKAQPRRFRRQPTEQNVSMVLGLSSVHSQLCNHMTFDSFLAPYQSSVFAQDRREERFQARETIATRQAQDVWQYSFDAGGSKLPDIPSPEEETPNGPETEYTAMAQFRTRAMDMSPRGYRLLWADQVPSSLVMGEVVSLKPEGSPHWTIGLLRWLRQYQRDGLRLGVELLSPKAEACAARILNKTGQHSDFLRAIVLPEIKAVAQPESIILPRLKAQTGQKIMLYRGGNEQTYQLVQKITETSAVGQFSIRRATGSEPKSDPKAGALDLNNDPLWRQF